MAQDICDVINRKIWTVEELLSCVDEIVEKSRSLSPNKRKKISTTISDWSEDRVRKYIDTLKGAVINPLKHKNKEKLKEIGVNIEKIPENVFDNPELVVCYINAVNNIAFLNICAILLLESVNSLKGGRYGTKSSRSYFIRKRKGKS
ncbi:MAG: hypothetical protein ACTSQE_17220 [Candidatus Heimdallarchaeaceae archaeon]